MLFDIGNFAVGEGYFHVFVDISAGELNATVALLKAIGVEALAIPTDVTDETGVASMVYRCSP